ncbi:hypothetical protein D3C80_205910 [compost metagenome]
MFSAKRRQEFVVTEQAMLTIGNQQRRFDLRRIGVQLIALVAKQRIHRHHANFQQRKESHVELDHVTQLHQRGIAAVYAPTQQGRSQPIGELIKLAIAQAALRVDQRDGVIFSLAGDDVGQWPVGPISPFAIATG